MATDHITPDDPGGERIAPGERGATVIADRVVAKIAAQAAREALNGVPKGANAPHATVTVRHDAARVRISLELDYPSDIGRQCGAVRRTVTERVETLAGMEVPEVAVLVERLHSAHSGDSHGRAQGKIA
ncbi:Asp23/Gls24 family envelope stress response protein [Streptomyces albipurpureus]|uniref:Alkaline shock response membrane anchor protein AmaP n=1 Tax=Streptomyces albipurpureus TaxID=2897419 RepID=A0ABT0USX7_9ACTN|nr:alkaline shock response membrane anchor protein AmaP [Streptomyces sp. CWNU-1]MCM2391544.1 alkaline shock response membrane anchor protein AmaP [Streptomyces sp. CWNU-1]